MTDLAATRRVGASIVSVYLVVVAATLILSGHRVLPLFEGIGPPPAYRWVHPPSQFAAGNTKPKPVSSDVAFSAGKTRSTTAYTPDGQFIVNFAAGAFAPHDIDGAVHVTITPLDPATLGPLPAGLAPDGNAYRIQFAYQPSNTGVDTLAVAGDVVMTTPHTAQTLLYSADGAAWAKVPSQVYSGGSTVGATFTRAGWYLAGATGSAVGPSQHGKGLGTAVIAALVAGLAVVLAATPFGLRAVRKRRTRRNPGKSPRRRGTTPGGRTPRR
ncbi:MAG: hypothetical protein ACYDH6_04540 [Acidimicrobiales bacterium]